MKPHRSKRTLWREAGDGKREFIAEVEEASATTRSSLHDTDARVASIRRAFEAQDMRIANSSGLGQLLSAIQTDMEHFRTCLDKHGAIVRPFRTCLAINACFLDRIAGALSVVTADPSFKNVLAAMCVGSMDLLDGKRSRAKDALWELELFALLSGHGLKPVLEEPDIVIAFEDMRVGIACKKFYSQAHVQNVVSKAVRQVERELTIGLAALNLDDLLPPNMIMRAPDLARASDMIKRRNMDFLRAHERHIEKYLISGRFISAIVSTTALTDTTRGPAKFNNVNDTTSWIVRGLPPEKHAAMERFHDSLLV